MKIEDINLNETIKKVEAEINSKKLLSTYLTKNANDAQS